MGSGTARDGCRSIAPRSSDEVHRSQGASVEGASSPRRRLSGPGRKCRWPATLRSETVAALQEMFHAPFSISRCRGMASCRPARFASLIWARFYSVGPVRGSHWQAQPRRQRASKLLRVVDVRDGKLGPRRDTSEPTRRKEAEKPRRSSPGHESSQFPHLLELLFRAPMPGIETAYRGRYAVVIRRWPKPRHGQIEHATQIFGARELRTSVC